MKESTIVSLITFFLLLVGFFLIFFSTNFNFYKSEISIEDSKIIEKLNFKPDKSYHTLFREFVDPISITGQGIGGGGGGGR